MAKQTMKALKSLFQGLEQQIFQGTSVDADGFTGFQDSTILDGLDDAMVVDAGGSGGRSVWLIRTTEDDMAIVAGNEGNIKFDFDPDAVQKIITNTGTGAGYNALNAALGSWYAIQFGSIYTVARIANLDGTNTNTLTDDMLSEAISKFPATKQPNLIVADRTTLKELQQSRTATNPTGAPAPFPENAFGIDIVVTDQLGSGEAALVTTTAAPTTTA
jgi:hypothetical protein